MRLPNKYYEELIGVGLEAVRKAIRKPITDEISLVEVLCLTHGVKLEKWEFGATVLGMDLSMCCGIEAGWKGIDYPSPIDFPVSSATMTAYDHGREFGAKMRRLHLTVTTVAASNVCSACRGTGYVNLGDCRTCGGKGVL